MDSSSLVNFQLACHRLLLANCLFLERKNINLRRWWVRDELKRRDKVGAHKRIFLHFKKYDHEKFQEFVGMNIEKFNYLHKLTKVQLQKSSYRKSLDPELKLSTVLNLLVHGGNVTNQSWFFLIGRSTMYKIIPEVCESICKALEDYVQFPKGDEFLQKAEEFYQLYDMPNTVGIVDGKHMPIKAPPKSGSYFRNFKNGYRINLMAVCDARGKIMWASVGDFGSKNDAGNFINSSLGIALAKEDVDFPADAFIPKTHKKSPFFFLADGGFSLSRYLMTPFRQMKTKPLPLKCKIFNIRLQRPRKTIERVFGIMTKKWRIIKDKVDFKLKTIDLIVNAIVHLYNYTLDLNESENFRSSNSNSDTDSESDTSVDTITSDSSEASIDENNISDSDSDSSSCSIKSSSSSQSFSNSINCQSCTDCDENEIGLENAENVRDYLTEYFMNSKGSVPWQWLLL